MRGDEVRIIVSGTQAKLLGKLPPEVLIDIDKMCSYMPPGIEFSKKVKEEEWDGVVHLFRNRNFPIGLLERMQLYLVVAGISFTVEDARKIRTQEKLHCTYDLRDYQVGVVDEAMLKGQALIPVCVGGGKTIIATALISRLGVKTLVVCPSIEIMEQTKRVLNKGLEMTIGIIHSRKYKPGFVTVTTWQTISARIKNRQKYPECMTYLGSVDCVIFDEVHHLAADKIFNVAMHIPATYRYGLSGSLFRTDGQELKYFAGIGETVNGVTASELIERGYLVPPVIEFVRTEPMPFGWKDKWRDVYEMAVVYNENRNKQVAHEAQKLIDAGRFVLVLVSEAEQGKVLEEYIEDGVFVEAKTKHRREIIDHFRNGNIACLIATPLFDEGVDIPHIDAVVLAGAGKSPIKAVQRVGRGLRTHPGKKDVKVIDFCDPMKYLFEHSRERYEIYIREPKFRVKGAIPE